MSIYELHPDRCIILLEVKYIKKLKIGKTKENEVLGLINPV